eukprot:s1066_g1.t1
MTRRTAHCSTKLPSAWPTHLSASAGPPASAPWAHGCAAQTQWPCAGTGRGRVFRRLVARALARHFAGAFQEACLPYQFGLSTRACTEGLYIYKLLHTATELDPRATVLSIDAVGAYDHVSRQAMLEGLRSRPALVPLLPFARQFYAAPAFTPGSTTTATNMMWCKAKEENRAIRLCRRSIPSRNMRL